MPSDGMPDWGPIIAGVGTVIAAVGTAIVGIRKVSAGKTSDEDHRRSARDTAATANATLTLESIWRLVNELQSEVQRKSEEIERIERACQQTKAVLLVRVGELETEIRGLKETQGTLEERIRTLREQIKKEI